MLNSLKINSLMGQELSGNVELDIDNWSEEEVEETKHENSNNQGKSPLKKLTNKFKNML